MKIVLTGATGFVGGEVLAHLVADPEVEQVTCLVRRPVDTAAPTVESIVVDDFTAYPEDVLARLDDHAAYIWTLGGKDSDTADPALYARITHDFTLTLASALANRGGERTFCYLSGAGADPTETARLPWQRLTRHLKGRTERDLRALASTRPGFTVHCFRPGGVLPTGTHPAVAALAAPISVRVDRLADALIDVATGRVDGAPALLSNGAITRIVPRTPAAPRPTTWW